MKSVHDAARHQLVIDHQPLVKRVLMSVVGTVPRHVDRSELERAGTLGLVEAADRWSEGQGVPFEQYAFSRVRGAIIDALRAVDWAPRSLRREGRMLRAAEDDFHQRHGRSATDNELADALGMPSPRVHRIRAMEHRASVASLEESMARHPSRRTVSALADHAAGDSFERAENQLLHGLLRERLGELPESHRLVIIGYFLEGRTSDELAEFLGVSESRVSQIRKEGLSRLRSMLGDLHAA
jgi:RNA polymerase sigma factor for flagellar operon FliA